MGDPVPFSFEESSPSVRLRVIRDLWQARPPEPLVREVLAQPEVARLLGSLRRDGTWGSWLHRAGLSTENAVTRLTELGCPFEGPLERTVPPLLSLLKGAPASFLDLRQPVVMQVAITRVRRVAAGLRCQIGLGEQEEIARVVELEIARAHAFVRRARASGLPIERRGLDGGRREPVYRSDVFDGDGLPVPDLYWLRAVAFSPLRRDPLVRDVLRFMAGPEYQQLAEADLGLVIVDGRRSRPGFGVRRLEPEQALRAGRMGEALVVSELLARVGDPHPARRLIRFLAQRRDARGHVELPREAFARGGGYVIRQGWIRLTSPWRQRARAIDLTFRLLLLERLSGGPHRE